MAEDIVTRLRRAAVGLPQDDMNQTAADEIERLRAELEQARLNLQHARTGKALLELEQERARTAELRNAFSELAALCQRLLTERFNDMTEGTGGTTTPTLPATDTTAR